MRKLLLIVVCVCIACPSWSGMVIRVVGSCSTYTSADTLNEGFVGSGFENVGWNTDNGGGRLDEDYDISALTTNKPDSDPANPCNEGLRADVTDDGSGTYESSYTYDLGEGSELTNYTVTVTFYLQALGDGDYVEVLIFSDNSAPQEASRASLRVYNSSGTYQMRMYGNSSDTGYDNIQAGWNTLVLDINRNASSSATLNGSSVGTFTMYDYDTRYIHIGAARGVIANDDIDIVFGDIHIENDDA